MNKDGSPANIDELLDLLECYLYDFAPTDWISCDYDGCMEELIEKWKQQAKPALERYIQREKNNGSFIKGLHYEIKPSS